MNKTAQLIAWVAISSALALLLVVVFWAIYPYKTLVVNKNPQPVLNDNHTVRSGGYLMYTMDYCKYTSQIPEVSKSFVDDIVYSLPQTLGTVNPLGCHTQTVQVYIPKELPLATYVLKTTYRYSPNPIRDIDIKVATEPFTVVK